MNSTDAGLLVISLILLFAMVSFYLDFVKKKDNSR